MLTFLIVETHARSVAVGSNRRSSHSRTVSGRAERAFACARAWTEPCNNLNYICSFAVFQYTVISGVGSSKCRAISERGAKRTTQCRAAQRGSVESAAAEQRACSAWAECGAASSQSAARSHSRRHARWAVATELQCRQRLFLLPLPVFHSCLPD